MTCGLQIASNDDETLLYNILFCVGRYSIDIRLVNRLLGNGISIPTYYYEFYVAITNGRERSHMSLQNKTVPRLVLEIDSSNIKQKRRDVNHVKTWTKFT